MTLIAAYAEQQQRSSEVHRRPSGNRTSTDSDHTSYYQHSLSTETRPHMSSGPSSATTYSQHSLQQLTQPGYSQGYYQQAGGSYPHLGQSPYFQGSVPIRSSSRRSAESVRVLPTQPKAASAYQDRSSSFSGMDRPNLMRLPSHSPHPSSSISELPLLGGPGTVGRTLSHGHGHITGGPNSQEQLQSLALRRVPIVYPALLSRVGDAFKTRITLAERTKDGLSYKDAFDGREAVDKIAYIIRTTDRNLALLLGRALDAQKFFHDVTYDHRLRDSPHEMYQFRERLHTDPFGSGDPSNRMLALDEEERIHFPRPPSPTDTMLSDEASVPVGVFTLLTDCYSPTCTRGRLCYSIACPRRLEQQARLNLKPKPGLKEQTPSEEQTLGDDDRLGSVSIFHHRRISAKNGAM